MNSRELNVNVPLATGEADEFDDFEVSTTSAVITWYLF